MPTIKQDNSWLTALKHTQRAKTRISHLVHPLTKHKFINPQDTADAFADYYGSLYNLRDDEHTHKPTKVDIKTF